MRRPTLAALSALAVLVLGLTACGNQASPIALTTVGPTGEASSAAPDEPEDPSSAPGPAQEPTEAPPADPVETSTIDLQVGNCLLEGPSQMDTSTVTVVNCGSPHMQEVYHISEAGLADYDETALKEEAGSGCQTEFETVTRGSSSSYNSVAMIPSQEAWDAGTHSYYCFIYSSDESEITGSVVEGNAEPGGSSGSGDSGAETT